MKVKIKNSYVLGQIIQQCRLYRGYSQREFSKIIGATQKWVWEMEKGKPGIMMDRLFATFKELGITLTAEIELQDEAQNE